MSLHCGSEQSSVGCSKIRSKGPLTQTQRGLLDVHLAGRKANRFRRADQLKRFVETLEADSLEQAKSRARSD